MLNSGSSEGRNLTRDKSRLKKESVMPTLLVLGHSETGDRKTKKILVAESFEEVMNKIAPITPPASSLENRQAMTYTQLDGRSIYLFTPIIRVVADVLSIEDDEDD